MKFRLLSSALTLLLLLGAQVILADYTQAQNRFDALRYNMVYPGQDAATMAAPSYTTSQDLGAVLYNPATTALFDKSFFSFDIGTRQVREEGTYLGNTTDVTATQTAITQAGLNFKAPTDQGSLVFGVGYNQLADYNRAQDMWGFSEQSSITDLFLLDDYYFDTAFESFALDEFEDNGEMLVESSWRPPFSSEFVGIDQYVDITERGHLGEYYVYGATEFQPGFFVGGSIGIPSGRYHYDRTFIEERPLDVENDYDIESILTEDRIRATVSGFTGRVGFLYRPTAALSIGANVEIPGALSIEENFDTFIETTFIDGSTEAAEFDGTLDYEVRRPMRLGGGITIAPITGLEISGGAEWVDYSNIEFSGLDQSAEERRIQREENRRMSEGFEEVVNLFGSLSFNIADVATPRASIAYYPSPVSGMSEMDRYFYSAGIGFRVGRSTTLDIGVQAANWQQRVYDYLDIFGEDMSDLEPGLEMPDYTQSDIWRIHGMVGITIGM